MNQRENSHRNSQPLDKLIAIAEKFQPQGKIIEVREYGSGNINHTFLVTVENVSERHFILQRLNTQIFCQPQLVMDNICTFSDHVHQRLKQQSYKSDRRWLVPSILLTDEGKNYYLSDDGLFWRAMSFIDNSQTFDTIQNLDHATEIGYGLGMFHNLISDLAVDRLADTLEGFHITPSYLHHYQQILASNPPNSSPEINYCLKFIQQRTSLAHVLETAKADGKLKLQPIHGDPKINNIAIDRTSQQAIAMLDLDTVKPGLIHYDLGDCLRSGCNPLGEETGNLEAVTFEPEIAAAILKGYLSVAQDFLSDLDYEYIYIAIRLLAFELGLRFFTDYLAGNVYFKANSPEHNLARALVQFKLTESIEAQATTINQMIHKLR